MTIQELILKLQQAPDPSLPIVVDLEVVTRPVTGVTFTDDACHLSISVP